PVGLVNPGRRNLVGLLLFQIFDVITLDDSVDHWHEYVLGAHRSAGAGAAAQPFLPEDETGLAICQVQIGTIYDSHELVVCGRRHAGIARIANLLRPDRATCFAIERVYHAAIGLQEQHVLVLRDMNEPAARSIDIDLHEPGPRQAMTLRGDLRYNLVC